MTAYNHVCPFCNSEPEVKNESNQRFRSLFCNKCNFKIEYSYSIPYSARSFLSNTSFRSTELQLPPQNSEFNVMIIYSFKENKLILFNYFHKPILSTFIKPDINLIKSIAIKSNKLSKII